MTAIKTYNDLLEVAEKSEQERMDFILSAIGEYKGGDVYKTAKDAEAYYNHENPTIMRYQKFVFNRFGQKVPNTWSPNNKIASNWYNYFTSQAVQYLLGNGVTFKKEDTKERLGKDFDYKVQKAATAAKNGSVAFGFWNLDHLEVFAATEFVPLFDEEDGGLKAGIRFWQINDSKPLRCTLYELDGYTDYIRRRGENISVLHDKRSYKLTVKKSQADGEEILDGENYAGFPIVPLWNINKKSDIIGNRGTIDAYDLMISGLINNASEGEYLYWILTNCDGMSEDEVLEFIEGLALNHVAKAGHGEDGSHVDAHRAEVPFAANAESLNRLRDQLYQDFMALRVEYIGAGATNDQIQAAYEPLNQKTDQFEYQVTEFIMGILELAGIEDKPTYSRSQMSNRSETLGNILQAAEYLDSEYITKKILTLLGDDEMVEEVLKRKTEEEAARYQQQVQAMITEKAIDNNMQPPEEEIEAE